MMKTKTSEHGELHGQIGGGSCRTRFRGHNDAQSDRPGNQTELRRGSAAQEDQNVKPGPSKRETH
eukprot:14879-Amphidinium_carterae.1